MPYYEYQCPKCGHEFEVMHTKITDKKEACPKCGSKAKKLISECSFGLKGTGWAADGYSKK
jgi:putative FmdB family regulatory protein